MRMPVDTLPESDARIARTFGLRMTRTATCGVFWLVATILSVVGAGSVDAAESLPGVTVPDGRLPAYVLEMPETVTEVLVADTGSASLHRFGIENQRVISSDVRYMSIGTAGAGKQRAWDRKTPLGIYFITESLDTSKLHDKYGVAAYPLDYPNAWDRHNQRTGYGIWLHGVDHKNPQRPPLDTDGCLALPNEALLQLGDTLRPLATPIIVTRELRWSLPVERERLVRELRNMLDTWAAALEEGDLYTYLSLYANEFTYAEMDRDAWAAYRYNTFSARKLSAVSLDSIMLLADPDVADLYLSRFTQVLYTNDGPVTTTKRLYWRRDEDARWQIVSEDAG